MTAPSADFPLFARLQAKALLPPRARDAHKGRFGHVLVVGGDEGYGGAAIMAAQAAVHSGAGLVSLFSREAHTSAMLTRQPEVMAHHRQLAPLLAKASVVVAGPGLGQQAWGQALLSQVFRQLQGQATPLLLDADALNYLASLPTAQQQALKQPNWLLTPHPGEAARLLGIDTASVTQHRQQAVIALQQQFGGTVLLKGQHSLICGPNKQYARLDCGNPGMASGGMGDVLSGIIAALLAQGLSGFAAACLGGWLHGTAADIYAAQFGERGLHATAILPHLSKLLNGIPPHEDLC